MTSLLFIHGTGVRGPAYDLAFAAMRRRVGEQLPGVRLEPCLWGDAIGTRLHLNGASIPGYDAEAKRWHGTDEATVRSRETTRWGLLYDDPLYELRSLAALAADEGGGAGAAPGVATPAAAALQVLTRGIEWSPPVRAALAEVGHEPARPNAAPIGPRALQWLVGDPVFAEAIASPGLSEATTARLTLARAYVAAWMVVAQADGLPLPSAEVRDAMYGDVVLRTGGAPAGIRDIVSGIVGGLATAQVRKRRTALTDASLGASGDVLRYQSRGQALRDFIAARIAQVAAPVYVLAHSLGGIAAFELLAAGPVAGVAGFITAGSQAPFLYEMDALATLRQGTPLRADFPPWLNFYDQDDILSYVGAGVFPGRVTDVEVESRQPFPQSHSAYWSNPVVWRGVADMIGP